jgi:hypothetical protein
LGKQNWIRAAQKMKLRNLVKVRVVFLIYLCSWLRNFFLDKESQAPSSIHQEGGSFKAHKRLWLQKATNTITWNF